MLLDVRQIDGVGGILAEAAPCVDWPLGTTAIGVIRLDVDDINTWSQQGLTATNLVDVLTHEIGASGCHQNRGIATQSTTIQRVWLKCNAGAQNVFQVSHGVRSESRKRRSIEVQNGRHQLRTKSGFAPMHSGHSNSIIRLDIREALGNSHCPQSCHASFAHILGVSMYG